MTVTVWFSDSPFILFYGIEPNRIVVNRLHANVNLVLIFRGEEGVRPGQENEKKNIFVFGGFHLVNEFENTWATTFMMIVKLWRLKK